MNGWTPTPRNTERVEYDLNRNEEFIAKSLVYNLTRTFATTEADADYLHELVTICDTDPAHIASARTQDPRIARRDAILAAFRDEPLSKSEAAELYSELAEIDQALQFHPSDTCQDYITAAWDKMEPIQF